MEYVKIVYGTQRDVYIDGNRSGRTNRMLRVEEGTHRIDLGEPVDYTPTFRRPTVSGTNQFNPTLVRFD